MTGGTGCTYAPDHSSVASTKGHSELSRPVIVRYVFESSLTVPDSFVNSRSAVAAAHDVRRKTLHERASPNRSIWRDWRQCAGGRTAAENICAGPWHSPASHVAPTSGWYEARSWACSSLGSATSGQPLRTSGDVSIRRRRARPTNGYRRTRLTTPRRYSRSDANSRRAQRLRGRASTQGDRRHREALVPQPRSSPARRPAGVRAAVRSRPRPPRPVAGPLRTCAHPAVLRREVAARPAPDRFTRAARARVGHV